MLFPAPHIKKAALLREQPFVYTLFKLRRELPVKLLCRLLIRFTVIKSDNRCCVALILHYEGHVAILGVHRVDFPHSLQCLLCTAVRTYLRPVILPRQGRIPSVLLAADWACPHNLNVIFIQNHDLSRYVIPSYLDITEKIHAPDCPHGSGRW